MRKLVLSHLSPTADDPNLAAVVLKAAQKDFTGEIVVGTDLMEI